MNEKNIQYLQDSLKYMGFGEGLQETLRHNILEGKPAFTLELRGEFHQKELKATLHFRKGENGDLYFFNKWDGKLLTDVGNREHTFYLNKGQGMTLKEGFNLLEGRAVHKELQDKEGQKYKAWVQLDLKSKETTGQYKVSQYHQNYGFDLEKELSRLPIKELSVPEGKDALLRSLEKGNLQSAIFEKNGFSEKFFIEAAPRFKSLNIYDHAGHKLLMENVEKRFQISLNKGEGEVSVIGKAATKVNGKEGDNIGGKNLDAKRQSRISNQKQESKISTQAESLLPKKRRSENRGLHH